MKRTNTIFYLVIGSILLVSCTNNENSTEEDVNTTVNYNHEELDSEQLVLNNGEKWKVNEEMMPFILESEQLVLDFDVTEYMELAENLMELNKKLISSCTMDGPSHDELHKWLHPHIDLLKKLKAQEDRDSSDKVLSEIKDSFIVFHEYFE